MSRSLQPDQTPKHPTPLAQAKPMLAAVLGAIIGCGASLHVYYTLLGGADQTRRLAQVESTVEHNRQVGEQTLALLKQMQTEGAGRSTQGDSALSKKPTQRELTDALEGLFKKLPDETESDAAAPTKESSDQVSSGIANSQEKEPEMAGGKSDGGGEVAASEEAAKK